MESGVFCVCRIPRKDGSAPRGRELYAGRARPPVRAEEGAGSARSAFMPRQGRGAGQPAFMRTCRIRGVREILWEATLYQEKFACQDSGF